MQEDKLLARKFRIREDSKMSINKGKMICSSQFVHLPNTSIVEKDIDNQEDDINRQLHKNQIILKKIQKEVEECLLREKQLVLLPKLVTNFTRRRSMDKERKQSRDRVHTMKQQIKTQLSQLKKHPNWDLLETRYHGRSIFAKIDSYKSHRIQESHHSFSHF